MSSNYMSTLPAIERERYIHKLNLVNLKTCPFIPPASNWCNNPTQWPEVSYPDIYLYLIESPGKPVNDFTSFLKVNIFKCIYFVL